MNESAQRQIADYLGEAEGIDEAYQIRRWENRVSMFLREAVGTDMAADFGTISAANELDELALRMGFLEGILSRESKPRSHSEQVPEGLDAPTIARIDPSARRIFIVHGHDGESKEAVARFLGKLGLDPIILHEQPNEGRTIIEKFEKSSSDVAFAVALLTPDDLGRAASESALRPRARQNVILELGYFIGRLGRTRVCALHKGEVELPSDYQGILYIEFDAPGAWKAKLAQEFVQAKLTINLQALINM